MTPHALQPLRQPLGCLPGQPLAEASGQAFEFPSTQPLEQALSTSSDHLNRSSNQLPKRTLVSAGVSASTPSVAFPWRPKTQEYCAFDYEGKSSFSKHEHAAVRGAQFRVGKRLNILEKPAVSSNVAEVLCPGCRALTSKLQRAKQEAQEETAKLRDEHESAVAAAESISMRVRDLETQLHSIRRVHAKELSTIRRQAEKAQAREIEVESHRCAAVFRSAEQEQQVRDALEATRRELKESKDQFYEHEKEVIRAQRVAQMMRDELMHSEALAKNERARLESELQELRDVLASTRESLLQQGNENAELARDVAEVSQQLGAALEKIEEQKVLIDEETAARRAAEAKQHKQQVLHESERAHLSRVVAHQAAIQREVDARCNAINDELLTVRELHQQETQKADKLAAARKSAQLDASIAVGVLRAELEHVETCCNLRCKYNTVEERPQAKTNSRRDGDEETAKADLIQSIMGTIRIAVIAPCVKLHIKDSETIKVGSPLQVDFDAMGRILEQSVLTRWSQIKTFDDNMDMNEAVAGQIFPDLNAMLSRIQQEVSNRVLEMMRSALS